MSRVIVKRAACAVLSVSLVGCASVHSQRINGKGEGLVYFLPKQDFVLTVTMKQKVVETATLSETPAYPDLTQQFVAAAAYPLLTKNLVQIEVDKNGLLHNATKSGITSQVDSVLNAAASAAGTLGAATKMTVAPELKKMECTDNGSNVYVFSPESKGFEACGIVVSIEPLGSLQTEPIAYKDDPAKRVRAGLYYRRLEPYLVRAAGKKNLSAVLMSPSKSPTYFAPVSRSLFSPSDTTVTFANGVATKYDRNSESEILGVVKLPAGVISAYFTAVGGVFDAFKTRDQKESEAIAKAVELELARKKLEECQAAVATNDPAQVKTACAK